MGCGSVEMRALSRRAGPPIVLPRRLACEREPMSYPTPPGGGSPYGQSPPQNGWQQQGQGASPVPPIPIAPPGMTSAAVPAQWGPPQQGAYYPPGGPVPGAPVPPSGGGRTVRRVFGGLLAAF